MNCWSNWFNYYLQKLTILIPTAINYANLLLTWLKKINNLPSYAFMFTPDDNSMYNNIDTEHTERIIETLLDKLSILLKFPVKVPLKTVKAAMDIIIQNNYFES